MINGSEPPSIVKRRPRRIYTLEDKKKFYTHWKNSGTKKNDFCIKNDLSPSVFDKWCRKFDLGKNSTPLKNDWMPLLPKNNIAIQKNEVLKIEVELPSSMKACLFLLVIILCLQELLHAITVVR